MFQFTLPRGERLFPAVASLPPREFQFTLPRGERHWRWGRWRNCGGFNSRSRVGSDRPRGRACASAPCFNSRSRVGSDRDRTPGRGLAQVSIHAPAWGATPQPQLPSADGTEVSIHAPAWGATRLACFSRCAPFQFQFTLPRGERPSSSDLTPTWARFNSRSRVGSDSKTPSPSQPKSMFQFTLPRGERLATCSRSRILFQFQFTLPRGERPRPAATPP